jgi:hypothetical protein
MGLEMKDYQILKALMQHPYHTKLIALAMWCSVRHSQFLITSAYRPDKDSVHGHFRGLDLRSHWFSDPQQMVLDINTFWEYDPKRTEMKCAVIHGPPDHFHLQVCDRTIYHEEGGRP